MLQVWWTSVIHIGHDVRLVSFNKHVLRHSHRSHEWSVRVTVFSWSHCRTHTRVCTYVDTRELRCSWGWCMKKDHLKNTPSLNTSQSAVNIDVGKALSRFSLFAERYLFHRDEIPSDNLAKLLVFIKLITAHNELQWHKCFGWENRKLFEIKNIAACYHNLAFRLGV